MYEQQKNAIAECLRLVADSYKGHEESVLNVIDRCQNAIEEVRKGAIGPWELTCGGIL